MSMIKPGTVGKARTRTSRRVPIFRRKLGGVTVSIQQRNSDESGGVRVVIHDKASGKRRSKDFDTIARARAFADLQIIEASNAGARAATEIGDTERRVLMESKQELAAYGKTVSDAVTFYLAHLKNASQTSPVETVFDELMHHKRTEGKSPRYLLDLNSRLGRFSRDFAGRAVSGLTAEELNTWLSGLKLTAVGTNNFRRCVAVLLNFAAARGWCPAGVMRQTVRMKTNDHEPAILTLAECAALLGGAHSEILPALALGLFAGIRDAELRRLDWRAVDLEGESVVIGPGIAKVGQRRVIPIRENLRAWLEPHRRLAGPILTSGHRPSSLLRRARAAIGYGAGRGLQPWPTNALRHSYASYRLAMWPDASALALEMGNSPAVILRHYRQLVKPPAAASFWKIMPHAKGSIESHQP